MIKDLSNSLDLILSNAEDIYFIHNLFDTEGFVLIKEDKKYYKIGVKDNSVDLQEANLKDYQNEDNIVKNVLYFELKEENKSVYKCNTKKKTNEEVYLLFNTSRKRYIKNDYIYYNIKKNKIFCSIGVNMNVNNSFIILKDHYTDINNRITKTTSKTKEANISDILKDYSKNTDDGWGLEFKSLEDKYTFIKHIIMSSKLNEDEKDEYIVVLIYSILNTFDSDNILSLKMFFCFLETVEKLEDEKFQEIFKKCNPKIKIGLKMTNIEYIRSLEVFAEDDNANLSSLSPNDIDFILSSKFKGKDNLFLRLIKEDSVIEHLKKEKEGRISLVPIFSYVEYLLSYIKDNFKLNKKQSTIYLNELIKVLDVFNLNLGYMDFDKLIAYNNLILRTMDLDFNLKNNINVVENQNIVDIRYHFNKYDNYVNVSNYIGDDLIFMIAVLSALDLLNLDNQKDIDNTIYALRSHNFKYKNLQELIELYLKANNEDRKLIEDSEDYDKIKEDLKFFN